MTLGLLVRRRHSLRVRVRSQQQDRKEFEQTVDVRVRGFRGFGVSVFRVGVFESFRFGCLGGSGLGTEWFGH